MKLHACPILFITAIFVGFWGSTDSRAADEGAHTPTLGEHRQPVEKHTHPVGSHIHEELRQIKLWLAEIERDSERRPLFKEAEPSEELFPLQTSRKTQLNGGMTLIIQGALNNEIQFGGDRTDGNLSLDMILSSEIRDGGLLIIRGDFMRGEGLTRLPSLFAGGVNADIEDFSTGAPDTFHLIEALYEQTWDSETFRLSIGQIDLTSYFDQNQFANSETFQFLSPAFGNNIAVAWGGDANGYGPGLVLHAHPVREFEINIGFFEGDGNYKDVFDQGFWIVEVEYELYSGDLEGHYRLNYWSNESNHATLLNPAVTLTKNHGMGLSFDQAFTEHFGVWGRFGLQDGAVAKYDRHASIGLELKGLPGRSEDVLGIAVGQTWISDDYKTVSGFSSNEYLGEVYYNVSVGDGFYITPDFQYISNPGGNAAINPISIYGIRGQLDF